MPPDHLDKLNIEQRRAVEHGVGGEDGVLAAPLLVIAGAGSGKTNTLAHRVANLIVNGGDPRRILLMTFSRRAATEMSRRVESICAKVLGAKAGVMTDALTWAGTFHAIAPGCCGNMPSRSTMRSSSSDAAARKTKEDGGCDRAFTWERGR